VSNILPIAGHDLLDALTEVRATAEPSTEGMMAIQRQDEMFAMVNVKN
jgi:hypothetical protein